MEEFGTIRVNDICSIQYNVINAWTIELDYKSPHLDIVDIEGKIVTLSAFGHNVTLGQGILLNYGGGESLFKIHHITQVNKSKYKFTVETTKPTKTKHFLFPILAKNRDYWNYNTWLINVYLSNDLDELLLVYRFSKNDKYLEFEKSLRTFDGFCKITEYDAYTSIYHYKIPSQHLKDVELFITGKYSELSNKLKKSIMSFHNFKEDGQTYQILYKSETRRKQLEMDLGCSIYENLELYDIPLLTEEILII